MDELVLEVLRASKTYEIQPELSELPELIKKRLEEILMYLESNGKNKSRKLMADFVVTIFPYLLNNFKTTEYWDRYKTVLGKHHININTLADDYWPKFIKKLASQYNIDVSIDKV